MVQDIINLTIFPLLYRHNNMINTTTTKQGFIDTTSKNDADEQPASVEADQNYQFYKEYCRLYYANIILTNRL